MGYKLEKPFTDVERADFVCEHQGLNYYEDDKAIYMYANSEALQNGEIVDISNTDDYKKQILSKQNVAKKTEIQTQIDSLDFKSIRALREGGIKDETTGETWVEYYTNKIETLRVYLNSL